MPWDELEVLYRHAPVGLGVIDSDLRFVRVNEWLAAINGVSAADHVGRYVHEVVPDLTKQAREAMQGVLTTGKPLRDIELVGETPAQPGVRRVWL